MTPKEGHYECVVSQNLKNEQPMSYTKKRKPFPNINHSMILIRLVGRIGVNREEMQ